MSGNSYDFWVKFVSFINPIFGLIIYFSTRDSYPETAGIALEWLKKGFWFLLVLGVLVLIAIGLGVFVFVTG